MWNQANIKHKERPRHQCWGGRESYEVDRKPAKLNEEWSNMQSKVYQILKTRTQFDIQVPDCTHIVLLKQTEMFVPISSPLSKV